MALNNSWFLEQARAGNAYNCATTGAVTLTTVSTTCTGLVISNPIGSGKNVVMWKAAFAPSTAPAGVSVVGLAISPGIQATNNTHTTPAVIHNAIASGSNANVGKALCDSAATLVGTPVWLWPLASVVATASITPTKYLEEINGSIILPPGTHLSFSYLTTAALGIAAFSWVEVDD